MASSGCLMKKHEETPDIEDERGQIPQAELKQNKGAVRRRLGLRL